MEIQKKITVVIVLVVLVSLVGILVIQAGWLNKAVLTNNEIFKQKVDLATQKASGLYTGDSVLPRKVHLSIVAETEEQDNVHQSITNIIDEAFTEVNLPLTYTYGLYKHKGRSHNEMVFGNAKETVLSHTSCNQKSGRNFGWANLTCNKGFGRGNDYHLAVFPSYGSYIFNEVKWSMITSVIFIGFILFGFLYTLNIIRRQRKLSELKNDFINNLTHEFKTPLFSISLASKSLRKSEDDGIKKDSSYLNVIDSETSHLKNQVDKILQLSMLDAGKLHLDKEKIDVHKQLEETAKSFQLQLSKKKGNMTFALKSTNPIIFGDRLHLKNVWYNIIDNALKYNEGESEIVISTKQINQKSFAILFKDNGPGIKQENQKMIFDRFYRETNGDVHNTKGFGIGLSYVKEILKLHDATILLEKSDTNGSTFKIIFPVHDN